MLVAVSCNKEQSYVDTDRFVVERTEISADYEGGTASIAVNTNASWRVLPEQDYNWMTIDKTSGQGTGDILLTFAKNEGDERSAVLSLLASGYDPVVVTITQEALKSDMRLTAPYAETSPVQGQADSFVLKVPYFNALGTETVLFTVSFSGVGAAGFEKQTVSCGGISAGDGVFSVPVKGTPTTLGPVTVTLEAFGDVLGSVTVRVVEKIPYSKYINWNNWSIGYTRSDFNLLRGSAYDYSWTSEAIHKTTSGVGTDHKALPSGTSLSGCEDAYLSLVCANPIVADGQASGPSGTPGGLAGYQFNPGYQVQGMIKDDYVFVYIPKVSIAAGGKITLESSLGGATAASNVFIVEYSTDNANWTAFGNTKTIEVDGTSYAYHFRYEAANSAMRYVYGRDASVDPAYNCITANVTAAVNGPLYIRFRSLGINGSGAIQTGTGWSDFKFIDINFD